MANSGVEEEADVIGEDQDHVQKQGLLRAASTAIQQVAAEKTTPNGARTANGSSKDRSEEAEAVDEERADGGGQTKTCEGQGEERHQGAEATRGVEEAALDKGEADGVVLEGGGCAAAVTPFPTEAAEVSEEFRSAATV